MKLLLLNAGSSSLKCTLIESSSGKVLSYGVADWAGPVTRYHYSTADGRRRSGLADVGVIHEFERGLPLDSRRLYQDPLCLVGPRRTSAAKAVYPQRDKAG